MNRLGDIFNDTKRYRQKRNQERPFKTDRPRRFFGLLCAHEWITWGDVTLTFTSGAKRVIPTLRCKHCGDVKKAWK